MRQCFIRDRAWWLGSWVLHPMGQHGQVIFVSGEILKSQHWVWSTPPGNSWSLLKKKFVFWFLYTYQLQRDKYGIAVLFFFTTMPCNKFPSDVTILRNTKAFSSVIAVCATAEQKVRIQRHSSKTGIDTEQEKSMLDHPGNRR